MDRGKRMEQKETLFYKKSGFWITLIAITAIIVFAICLNIGFARRTERIWIQSEGQLRLSNITSGVENNLAQAENYANSYAAQFEFLLQELEEPEDAVIYDFIRAQTAMLARKTEGQCFSTYVAYKNRLYIEGFVPDSSFHLSERVWYVGAKKNQGNLYITAPYVDASTGNMCYSVSMLLGDGETIVGLDFYMDAIQDYIEKMNEQIDGISMIVNEGGMIVGHNDASLLGQDYTLLKEYRELIEKVFNLYGNYFEYTVYSDRDFSGTVKYTVFSDKTTYGWYLIVCLPFSEISSGVGTSTLIVNTALVLLWALFICLYVRYCRKRYDLQRQVSLKEQVLQDISENLREPVTEISRQIRYADDTGEEFLRSLQTRTEELKERLDHISSFQKSKGKEAELPEDAEEIGKNSSKYQRYSAAIIGVLLTASVISIAVNTYTQFGYITAHMENEGEIYYSQTKSWIDTNITLTNDLALHLGAQPQLYRDYEKAVKYLDNIVRDNDDISVAYIVNPAWEHTVIMNNGWEPDDPDWHVEERDWYIDTVLSERGFNISTPYQDEQTGMYCVTFSQIVYDEAGSIVGLIGIDFYMDKLIHILGESYTAEGYAFLTDPAYIILNHPFAEYQMSREHSVSGAETEYRNALVSEKLTLLKDYNRKYMVGLAQREPRSGFTVVTVRNAGLIYGTLILTDIVLALVFLISILFVLVITRYMSGQQEKLNQELRIAADRAIEAGQAKSKFLAQMSHEIRTPINSVLGMNEMILREAKEDTILHYASNAYNAGNALLSIINDVLDISKIEAGKMEIMEAEYDLSSLIGDCYHMAAERAAKKDLKLSVIVEETLPSRLYGDMYHLRQIIVNFLSNAVKYTNEGAVELVFGKKSIREEFALKISVKDTGIGIAKENLEKLFNSFQRFDLERNQSVEGTGLGLSICRQLTKLMNGTLEVESVYGKGSTFTCTIPQKVISDQPIGKITLDSPSERYRIRERKQFTARDARILAVDDVEMNLLVFTGLLREYEFTIDTASGGKQCLAMIQKHKYDLIFMDHMMPEMDGMETFEQIKKTKHLNEDTPVIMLTANAIAGEREKYLEAGFASYLTKPIQSEKMEEVLLKYLPADKVKWKEESSLPGEEEADPALQTPHIDGRQGTYYTGGSREAYFTVLKNYVEEGEKKQKEIGRFCEQENWKDYTILVHALKSTSLTVGAKELSEAAKELELAGKEGNYGLIREKNGSLLELYRQVLEEGSRLLHQNTDFQTEDEREDERHKNHDTQEISDEKLREYAEKIRTAAENFDQEEMLSFCEELSAYRYHGKELWEDIKKIRQAADDFDYEEAARLTREWYALLTEEE